MPASSLQGDVEVPWFRLSQNFPTSRPTGDAPWSAIDYTDGVPGANDYLHTLRDYAFEGMLEAKFQPENNHIRHWSHMPLMNYDPFIRKPVLGLTPERPVFRPELDRKPTARSHTFVIGLYNAAGAVKIGEVGRRGAVAF